METKQNEVQQTGTPVQQETTPAQQETTPVQPEAGAQKPQGKGPKKGKKLFSNKMKRGGMTTLMTVVFIAIIVALNVVVSALTERFPSMDIDLTAQGLNTLSDQALEIAKGVEEDTVIYLIGTEEAYEQNQLYSSYGLEYSQVASLARRLAEANSHISVQFIDPDTNPQFISDYADDNLTSGKVLVKTDKRYRVLGVSDMFSLETDQNTGDYNTYSMVDSALAGALEMVNMEQVPVIALVTGHGEMLTTSNMGSFISMMEDQNFQVEEVDLLTQELPEDTQVVMLPTPTTDYSSAELDKLRAYLNDTTRKEPTTLVATCYPSQGELPNLAAFLEEWGVSVEPGVVAESDTNQMVVADPTGVLVTPNEDLLSDNTYDRLVSYYGSPLRLLFDANNEITTYEMWTTANTAYVVTEDTTEEEVANPETSSQLVATLSSKMVQIDSSTVTRSVMVFGSSNIFTDDFMNTNAFGDREYIRDMLLYLTANDGSKVTVSTQRVETNTMDVSASRGTIDFLGILFTAGLPVVILAAGLIIFLKRRHL